MSIHVGDTNVSLRITMVDSSGTAEDISGYSTLEMLLEDPSGNVATLTAAFVTDGTDGKIGYNTLSGTFDEAGQWRLQGKISDGTTTIHSDVAIIEVLPVLA